MILILFFPPVFSIRDDPYWTSRKNSLELIELSSINKARIKDDPYWTSRKNILELIELPSNEKSHLQIKFRFP